MSRLALYLSGMVGALMAILGDITQKDTASAVVKISTTVNSTLEILLPTLVWAGILIVLGLALSMIFDPQTKKMAFFTGASIIAIVMTATPYKPLPSSPSDGAEGAAFRLQPMIIPTDYTAQVWNAGGPEDVTLTVKLIVPKGGQASAVTITVLIRGNSGKHESWQRAYNVRPGQSISARWHLKPFDDSRTVVVRVESRAYKIATDSVSIKPGPGAERIEIALEPSRAPLFWKKLLEPYDY